MLLEDLRQDCHDPCCPNGRRYFDYEAFPRELVREGQNLQALTIRARIMDKILRPDLIGTRGFDGTQDLPIRSASSFPAGRHAQPGSYPTW